MATSLNDPIGQIPVSLTKTCVEESFEHLEASYWVKIILRDLDRQYF